MKSKLTVQEILQRRHFENTEVIAGVDGVNRQVKWVHVIEVTQFTHLLNGNELILTTGLGWKEDQSLFISVLKQLIACNVSGLCIEMGTHTNEIPKKIIDIANRHSFPIILFHEEVPFVQITQDVHSILINKQYQMISDLESYSQNLNKQLLEINHFREVLKICSLYLDVTVALLRGSDEMKVFPALREEEKQFLLEQCKLEEQDKTIAKQPVQLFGKEYAELAIFSKTRMLTEFDLLILDRTATALGQYLLRELYVEEKRMTEEVEWITSWLDGEYSDEALQEHLGFVDPELNINGCVVCICKSNTVSRSKNTDGTYFKIMFRNVLEQQGFHLFSTEIKHQMIFILCDKRSSKNWKERITQAFDRMNKLDNSGRLKVSAYSIGIGKFVYSLSEVHKSYKTAKETLLLQENLPDHNKSCFYDDLHLYRIISLIKKHADLQEIVNEYLEPVMEYDRTSNGELLETLKTYLACNGSKQETAKKLFIVRQTLYHRIDKLEKLLGKNFMSSERRIAIEFMLLAHEYLNKTEKKYSLQYKAHE